MKPLITYLQQFRHIPPEEARLIDSAFEKRQYHEGDYLFKGDGRVCRELFFICSGVARIFSVNDKATEVTHFFYGENKLCLILQSFNEETQTTAAIQASCRAEALVISKSKLMALYQQLPYLKQIIDEINQEHLIEKVNTRNAYVGLDAEDQYRLFMMQNPAIALQVPLKHIASWLGITPQSLSRIRKNIS
ncbi:MAG TPA: cyclic nucleotide-binding domain-containing protein [Mucilaginibacter sp.]|nr:cyclic nucleotide-binding domain-containing protein [Mucilaginibacter sp.]